MIKFLCSYFDSYCKVREMYLISLVNCYFIFNNLIYGVILMVKILEIEDCGRGCRDVKRNFGFFIIRDNVVLKIKNKVLKRF